jgi:hypothetical protein
MWAKNPLPEALYFTQTAEIFIVFYATQRFIAVFTTARAKSACSLIDKLYHSMGLPFFTVA